MTRRQPKERGQRSRAELAALFADMYAGWDRGVNMEGPDTGFRETPMTPMELEARYVAAEIGINIFEIANSAAFAPIIIYQEIQKRLGPLFTEQLALKAEVDRLKALIDVPHTDDWIEAVKLEAAHQVNRWGAAHDDGKEPSDWFWLIGYLAGKGLTAEINGDREKAKHHTISTGAVLLNWWRQMRGVETAMRPGIEAPLP